MSGHRSSIEDVSDKIPDHDVRVSVLDELRDLCERLARGLYDDADGTYAASRTDTRRRKQFGIPEKFQEVRANFFGKGLWLS